MATRGRFLPLSTSLPSFLPSFPSCRHVTSRSFMHVTPTKQLDATAGWGVQLHAQHVPGPVPSRAPRHRRPRQVSETKDHPKERHAMPCACRRCNAGVRVDLRGLSVHVDLVVFVVLGNNTSDVCTYVAVTAPLNTNRKQRHDGRPRTHDLDPPACQQQNQQV